MTVEVVEILVGVVMLVQVVDIGGNGGGLSLDDAANYSFSAILVL